MRVMENSTILRLIRDIKKYYNYTVYSAKSSLKSEVASSRLNWLWWVLDPLFFMLVYMFVSAIVFRTREQYFPIFVFIGISVWSFFEKTIMQSVRLVKANNAIVSKVYLPKYILIVQKLCINGFKMLISFTIVALMMLVYRVPITVSLLYFIPLVLMLVIVTFGVSTLVLHFGVFIEDLTNVTSILLKLVFYMSGIFYSLETRVPQPYNEVLIDLNPAAFVINELRKCMLYGQTPALEVMGLWLIGGILITLIGIKIIYKYENGYVKVS